MALILDLFWKNACNAKYEEKRGSHYPEILYVDQLQQTYNTNEQETTTINTAKLHTIQVRMR